MKCPKNLGNLNSPINGHSPEVGVNYITVISRKSN